MLKMFVALLMLLFLGTFAAARFQQTGFPESKEAATTLFHSWMVDYKKFYRTAAEQAERFEVFLDNLKHINFLNRQHGGEVTFDINQFADQTRAEFRRTVLMPRRRAPKHPLNRYLKSRTTDPLPDSFDWTDKGVVTAVKDQGSAGSCWAFSTIGNVEGQWARLGKPLTNFSVEQLVECDGTNDPKDSRADCGIYGGWPFLAYQYIQKAGGLETWEDYGYCCGFGGGKGQCFPCDPPGYNATLCGPGIPYCLKNESCAAKLDSSKFVPGLKVSDWKAVSENETEMAAVLMATGPLSVAMDATMLQFYRRGVFSPFVGCSKTDLDHAVLLVGWGVDKGLFEEKPYWKVKNSWGPKWGQDGYFLIKRGAGECGINTQVTTAVLQAP